MKNKARLVMNAIIVLAYVITAAIILIIYDKTDRLSDVYFVLSPLAITSVVCIILNMIPSQKDDKDE